MLPLENATAQTGWLKEEVSRTTISSVGLTVLHLTRVVEPLN